MVKKILIILSGVYLVLIGTLAAVGYLISIFSLSKEFKLQMPQFITFKPIFEVLCIIFLLCPIIIGLGIILKKNWARFSILLLSVFGIIIGFLSSIVLLVVPFPQDSKVNYPVVKLMIFVFYFIIFIAIPMFFIIFFNRKSVKELFVSKEGQRKSNRPFGITLIASLSFLSGLSGVFYAFKPFIDKLPLFSDIMLSGIALKVYSLIWAFVNIYIGIGLFKLRKAAWLTAISFKIFYIALGIINIFTISEGSLSQINSSLKGNNFSISLINYKIYTLIGLLFPIIIVIYLALKRNLFIHAEKIKDQLKNTK